MASRWPQRFPLAAAISRSTSASVRYSRVRSLALGSRVGVTVRFTVAGVTSLRCDLVMCFTAPAANDCSYNARSLHSRSTRNSLLLVSQIDLLTAPLVHRCYCRSDW